MKKTQHLLLRLFIPVCLSGCAVGTTSVLFATKSNFGLDMDTKPPTMEVGISRREAAIAPTYAENKTLPLYADFGSRQGTLNKFFLGLSSTFAGGNAAIITTNSTSNDADSSCVDFTLAENEQPHYWTPFNHEKPLPKEGRVRPFFFATDTVLGLKVVWNEPSDPVPDALKVGFNRKEFAWAPIYFNKGRCTSTNNKNTGDTKGGRFAQDTTGDSAATARTIGAANTYHADMPSFFALIRNRNDFADIFNSEVRYLQVFATGKAAEGAATILRETVQEQVRGLLTEAGSAKTSSNQGVPTQPEQAKKP